MKTIALISGGKDSLLAILAAYRYGHEPVVLVHLTPASTRAATSATEAEQELDSYMFQTVGSNVVHDVAHCLDLPLRLGYIEKGQSKDVSLTYSTSPDTSDEVEVLFRLLHEVKEEFPQVEGITTGAILSNYQRLRVEAVCFRLGLVSLSYLWMRKPAEILDMAKELKVKAVLVKTASIGLDPRALIGRTLEEVRPQLESMARQYGSHLAGEGGEYETMVLNFPMFKKEYLEIVSQQIVVVDDNPFAPSGHGILSVARRLKGTQEQTDDAALLKRLRTGKVHFASDVMPSLVLPSGAPTSESMAESTTTHNYTTGSIEHVAASMGLEVFATHEEDYSTGGEAIVDVLLERWSEFARAKAAKPYFLLFVSPSGAGGVDCDAFERAYERAVPWVEPPGRLGVVRATDSSNRRAGLYVYYYYSSCDGQDPTVVSVLHCQSRSHWAAGAFGPVAQGTRLSKNADSFCFVGPAYGLVPALGELATQRTFDSIENPRVQPNSDFEAEVCFAFANLLAYLEFFKLQPTDVSHLTCLVTDPALGIEVLQKSTTACSLFYSLFVNATVLFVSDVLKLPYGANVALLAKGIAL